MQRWGKRMWVFETEGESAGWVPRREDVTRKREGKRDWRRSVSEKQHMLDKLCGRQWLKWSV